MRKQEFTQFSPYKKYHKTSLAIFKERTNNTLKIENTNSKSETGEIVLLFKFPL